MLESILAGYRVLDLTQNVAGPFCGQILGDFGAEVIKVERPGSGDDSRSWRSPKPDSISPHFVAMNRNKRSICVDIANAEGQALITRLSRTCDIFLHSMKPGSAETRGFGYETLSADNPGLVYCAISAYGEVGPLKHLPGYDPVMQAFTGLMSLCGNEGDAPSRVPVSVIDVGTGLWAALGILGACLERAKSQKGSLVQVSLLETSLSWMNALITAHGLSGKEPGRIGTALANAAPYELFKASDGHVFIAAPNNRLFVSMCAVLNCAELAADPRFNTNAIRLINRTALHQLIEQKTVSRTMELNVSLLRGVGVPCSEMNTLAQAVQHSQTEAVQMISDWHEPGMPKFVELPIKMNRLRSKARAKPPTLGQDTDAVLEDAGLDGAEIADLRRRGTVA